MTPAEATSVLVVDDAEASRYLISSWLRRSGYRVTEASTGRDALSLLEQQQVDLVLLDVNLPDMSGLDVCAQVKTNPRTAVVPVIHVSATAIEPEDEARGLSGGADAYLLEPVDPRVLVATMEAVLRYYRARSVAERLAARLTTLTKVTLALNTATTFDALLSAAAEGATAMFGGPATALASTPFGLMRAAKATPDGGVRLSTERSEVPTLDSLPTVVTVDSVPWHGNRAAAVFVGRPKPSLAPVSVAVDAAKVSTEEDRQLFLQLGQATALACEGLRAWSEEHTIAVTLQRSLLPSAQPDIPGLSMATRYVPATHNVEIGGDFYEVADLGDRVLIAVGDVVGHSIQAATVMGEIRHALRAYAIEGHDTVRILYLLDAVVRRFHPTWFTTLCLMLVDPRTGEAEVASAGHIPPLLSDATGSRYLDIAGPLLGAGWQRPAATRIKVPPGTLVLLVTDGLVEQRNLRVDDGMRAIQEHVSHDVDLEVLCDSLLDRFGQDTKDDIALVAFRAE